MLNFFALDIPDQGPEILFPSELSRRNLPRPSSLLFRGHFLVLDVYLKLRNQEEEISSSKDGHSHIDIGFGDDRKHFAGMHRFEVRHNEEGAEGQNGDVAISFSSISCNPTVDKALGSKLVFTLHKFYALCLF